LAIQLLLSPGPITFYAFRVRGVLRGTGLRFAGFSMPPINPHRLGISHFSLQEVHSGGFRKNWPEQFWKGGAQTLLNQGLLSAIQGSPVLPGWFPTGTGDTWVFGCHHRLNHTQIQLNHPILHTAIVGRGRKVGELRAVWPLCGCQPGAQYCGIVLACTDCLPATSEYVNPYLWFTMLPHSLGFR